MKKYIFLSVATALALLLLANPTALHAQLAYPKQPAPDTQQEAINLLPPLTLGDVLRTVPGVYVNEPYISIRGNDAPPLFIVDGTWIGHGLDAVANAIPDVRTIESIEVLKSLAATAIYGREGANGVVVIRTLGTGGNDGLSVGSCSLPVVSQLNNRQRATPTLTFGSSLFPGGFPSPWPETLNLEPGTT